MIAEGGFSQVFLVRDAADPAQTFALKRVLCQTREAIREAQFEQSVHMATRHPHVMALLDSAIQESTKVWGEPWGPV